MRVKRTILLVVVAMLTVILSGCPPQITPPGDKLSAKDAWRIIEPSKATLSDDAVPVYIEGKAFLPQRPITQGMTYNWDVGFYSETERAVWGISYYSHQTENGVSPKPTLGEKLYSYVTLTASDLTDWKVDSPEACDIAAQNGAVKTSLMIMLAAHMDTIRDNIFKTPEFVPESTNLLWVIMDEESDFYYIDAHTGTYLGSCTVEQLDNIED